MTHHSGKKSTVGEHWIQHVFQTDEVSSWGVKFLDLTSVWEAHTSPGKQVEEIRAPNCSVWLYQCAQIYDAVCETGQTTFNHPQKCAC